MSCFVLVKPGQVWADKQKGEEGRTVEVLTVDDRYVYCRTVTVSDNAWSQRGVGRSTRILLDQLPKRFRLVDGGA